MMNCQICKSEMSQLIKTVSAESKEVSAARAHLKGCAACQSDFASFQSTFLLLDSWKAPEPSAYFDQKFAVLLREEAAKPSETWWERVRSHLLFNTGRQFRPALAGTMALALLIGGGTFAGISTLPRQGSTQASAAVDDLQILDKNDQALQQMDQLFQEEPSSEDTSTTPPIS